MWLAAVGSQNGCLHVLMFDLLCVWLTATTVLRSRFLLFEFNAFLFFFSTVNDTPLAFATSDFFKKIFVSADESDMCYYRIKCNTLDRLDRLMLDDG